MSVCVAIISGNSALPITIMVAISEGTAESNRHFYAFKIL